MKILAIPVLAAGLLLAQCGTTQQQVSAIISQVETVAQQLCGFLPTAQSIEAIFNAMNPAVATANAIAGAICSTVTAAPPAKLAVAPPLVSGVPVHGVFVSGPNAGHSL